jgi:hypothetical protein
MCNLPCGVAGLLELEPNGTNPGMRVVIGDVWVRVTAWSTSARNCCRGPAVGSAPRVEERSVELNYR